jgi:hypothetical protein
LNSILPTALLILGLAANASAQQIPKWELFGGYAEYLSGGGTGAKRELPTNGVQVELDRVVTSYFRITGQFNAQFADEVVDLAPLTPGASHVNSKELLGLFGPEATYRTKRLDIYGHYLIGVAYGRDNHDPAIPT